MINICTESARSTCKGTDRGYIHVEHSCLPHGGSCGRDSPAPSPSNLHHVLSPDTVSSQRSVHEQKVQRDGSARNHAYEVGGLEEVEGRRWEQDRRFGHLRRAAGDGSRLAAVGVGVGRVARHEGVHRCLEATKGC